MERTIRSSPLSTSLGVNGQVKCECGGLEFAVGVASNPETQNIFIRLLQCLNCEAQMPIVHRADSGLAPAVGKRS